MLSFHNLFVYIDNHSLVYLHLYRIKTFSWRWIEQSFVRCSKLGVLFITSSFFTQIYNLLPDLSAESLAFVMLFVHQCPLTNLRPSQNNLIYTEIKLHPCGLYLIFTVPLKVSNPFDVLPFYCSIRYFRQKK